MITYLAIEKDFEGLNNIEVAHFGAIEGMDRWGDVDVAVIIGRPLLWKTDAARLAAAITGKPVVTDTVSEDAAGLRRQGEDAGCARIRTPS